VLLLLQQVKRQALLTIVAVLTTMSGSWLRAAESVESTNSPARAVATVKFRAQNGRVMLPASVNGSEPHSFLLDTGYSITTIMPDLARSLQLRPVGKVTIVGIAGEEEAPTYEGAAFRLGDAVYSPRRVAAVPSEAQRRRRRDGIIGAGLFRRFVVRIDFAGQTVSLFEPATFTPVRNGEVVPLRFRRDTPNLQVTIPLAEGKSVEGRFELDTGCDDGLCVGRDFVTAHKLDEAFGAKSGGTKQGVGGDARIESATIPTLRFGAAEARRVSASFFRDGSPADGGLAGHVGMNALRQFTITLDYSRQQMILEPSPAR
jgi:hypothetical protein